MPGAFLHSLRKRLPSRDPPLTTPFADAPRPRVRLRALGWDHERCTAPMRACSEAWERLHPEVELVWQNRSLTAFGDEPLEEIAHRYDLIMIDHPFCGTA